MILSRKLAVVFVISLTVSVFSSTIVGVHAQSSGLVCIGGNTPPPPCPSTPPAFSQSLPGGNAVIFVQNSQPFNGFDISTKVDPSILNGTGFDLNFASEAFIVAGGTIFVASECINGHPIIGNCRSQDGPGIASIAVASNVAVTGGHLYNVSYLPIGLGSTSISYQTGCTGTSNSTSCVTLVNANTIDPENIQGATFTTSATAGFSITLSPASQTMVSGSSAAFTVTATGTNGFTGTINLRATVTPVVAQGPTTSLNPASLNLSSSSSQATSTLTVSTTASTPMGTYTVSVTGTSGSTSQSASASMVVNPNFSITANPNSQTIKKGSTATFTVTISSFGLAGTVSLSATVSPALNKGPSASLNPTSVTIVSGGSGSSMLTISTAKSTTVGSYTVTITGTSGSLTRSTMVTVTVIR